MPTGDLYDELSQTIHHLGQLYETPVLEPHVTLLGGVTGPEEEVTSKTKQLASQIAGYEIKLGWPDYLSEYFRCLFLRVEEKKPVMEASHRARTVFDRHGDLRYFPHLSLMYGRLGPGVKQTIVPRIGDYFGKKFEVSSIHLFSTEGEPRDWYRIREFLLEGARNLK